jgi:hypothetical protein
VFVGSAFGEFKCGRLDCGEGDLGYLNFQVTWISTHPHHYPKGQKLGCLVSNRNSWLISHLWSEDKRSGWLDDGRLDDV